MVHAGENSESVSIASHLTPSPLCVCVCVSTGQCTGGCCSWVFKSYWGRYGFSTKLHRLRFCRTDSPNRTLGTALTTTPDDTRIQLTFILAIYFDQCAEKWTSSWLGQLMSAAAWMQVVLLSGFKWHAAIRALHKAVHRAYQTSSHSGPTMVRCLYHIIRHMPATRPVTAANIGS